MSSNNDIMVGNRPLSSLRVVDLKQELEKRGLSKSGSKKDLVERLRLHLQIEKHRDTGASADEEELPNYSAHDELADQNPFIREYLASQAELFHSQRVVKKLVEEEAKRESETSADEGVDSPVKQPPPVEKESPKTETRRQSRRRADSQKEEMTAEKLMTRSSRSKSPAAATESENKSNNVQVRNEQPKDPEEVIVPVQKVIEDKKVEPPTEVNKVEDKESEIKTQTPTQKEVIKSDVPDEAKEIEKKEEASKEVEIPKPEQVEKEEASEQVTEPEVPKPELVKEAEVPKPEPAKEAETPKPEEVKPPEPDEVPVENMKAPAKSRSSSPSPPQLEIETKKDEVVEKVKETENHKADKEIESVEKEKKNEEIEQQKEPEKEKLVEETAILENKTERESKGLELVTQENDENSNLELRKQKASPAEEPMEVEAEKTPEKDARRSRSRSPVVKDKEKSPEPVTEAPKSRDVESAQEKSEKEDSGSSSEEEESSSRSGRRSRSSRSRSRSRSPSKSRSRSRSQSQSRSRSVESREPKKDDESLLAKQSEVIRDNDEESRDKKDEEPTRKRQRSRSVSKSPIRGPSPKKVISEKDKSVQEGGNEESVKADSKKIGKEEETTKKTLDRYKSSEKDSYSTKYDLAGEEALDYGEEEEDEDRGENDKPEFTWTRRVIQLKTKATIPAPEFKWKLEEDGKLIVVKSELLNNYYREVKLVPLEQLKLEERIVEKEKEKKEGGKDIERKPSLSKEIDLDEPLPTRTVENVLPTIKRTVSIVPVSKLPIDHPEENDKSLTPPRNPPSNVLMVTNLVRPFTLPQLKELLQRTGNIQDIWVDKIKSKCLVMFNTQEEAFETRAALHGVCWPSSNPKSLHVDYTTQDNLDEHKRKEGAEPNSVTEKPVSAQPVPVREWDVGKKTEPKSPGRSRKRSRSRSPSRERSKRSRRSSSASRRRHSRSPTHDRRSRGGEAKEPEPIGKALDELFRKTIATPSIYWLPLTPQQIAEKEELRRKRMLERERRLAELSKMRPR